MNQKHIRFTNLVHMSLANLWYKRSRSIITFIGITVGVGAIYLLLSFGFGLQGLLEGQVTGSKAMSAIDVSVVNSEILKLDNDAVNRLNNITGVKAVTGVSTLAGKVSAGGAVSDSVIYGVDAPYFGLSNFRIIAGELPQSDGDRGVVVNSGLLELIGIESIDNAVGHTIKVVIPNGEGEGTTLEVPVVGIIDSGEGSELFIMQSQLGELQYGRYSLIKVVAENQDAVPEIRQHIEGLGFATASPLDTIQQLRDTSLIVNIVLGALGSVGILIASLGMINTLTVSLLERTREIALMMTVGARRRDILLLFTIDALILSLLGGVLGILLAMAVGAGIDQFLNGLAHQRGAVDTFSLFAVSPLLILGVLVVMLVIGLTVSLFPARRASRINPVDAMREE